MGGGVVSRGLSQILCGKSINKRIMLKLCLLQHCVPARLATSNSIALICDLKSWM